MSTAAFIEYLTNPTDMDDEPIHTMSKARVAKILTPHGGFQQDVLHLVPGDKQRDVPWDEVASCGSCGRSWDDGQSTALTPAPSGRCPFEYEHEMEDYR